MHRDSWFNARGGVDEQPKSSVAHGRNTGQNMATSFSNTPHSNQSSLGFYVTGETYVGSKGYSLRLDGKENAFNDKIRSQGALVCEVRADETRRSGFGSTF